MSIVMVSLTRTSSLSEFLRKVWYCFFVVSVFVWKIMKLSPMRVFQGMVLLF